MCLVNHTACRFVNGCEGEGYANLVGVFVLCVYVTSHSSSAEFIVIVPFGPILSMLVLVRASVCLVVTLLLVTRMR